jgi:hypothetical protein
VIVCHFALKVGWSKFDLNASALGDANLCRCRPLSQLGLDRLEEAVDLVMCVLRISGEVSKLLGGADAQVELDTPPVAGNEFSHVIHLRGDPSVFVWVKFREGCAGGL